ncbi:MAG: class I SAM-dependent methyltransferase [Chloroflexota bacterium]
MNRSEWEDAYKHTRRGLATRRKRILEFGIPPNSRILDYGCGDGLDLSCLRVLGFQNVVGLDRSHELLHESGLDPVVVGDALDTPFIDGAFDVVLVDSVLHHVDVDRALLEIRRTLRMGGWLCIIEPVNGWPRRLLDLVTLSGIGRFIPSRQIRHRRIALRGEWCEYQAWLARQSFFVADLEKHGFTVVDRRDTLLSMIATCRRVR